MGPTRKSYFGDMCFEEMGVVIESISDDIGTLREGMQELAGSDGSSLGSLLIAPRVITLECRGFRDTWDGFDRLVEELTWRLLSRQDERLELRKHPGQHYLAHLTSLTVGERVGGTGIGAMTITMTAPDPVRYGARRSVAVPSGGSASFAVGGTYPADLTVSASATPSSGLWGLRFDGEAHLRVGMTSPAPVVIDCAAAKVSVGGKASMLTLDSDWQSLSPGEHTARMDVGTGAATIEWVERHV